MSRAAEIPFIAVTTEGGLLPGQLLQRIAQPDARTPLPGRAVDDYKIFGLNLEDEINREWNRLQQVWAAFQKRLAKAPPDKPNTGLTRDRWLMPLLQSLGFGRLPAAAAEAIGERKYAISHRYDDCPVHLLGYGVPLDKKSPGVPGAATAAPHSLVQGYLNRKDPDLWGILGNGRSLRILRDHESLTRQAYVEFDLEAIFDGDLFSDFRLMWLTCHQSRFESRAPDKADADSAEGKESPTRCWLEIWHGEAREQGIAWQDELREGVKAAIEALGSGYLRHPRNAALRAALQDPSDSFDRQGYYREVLRVVYRLIFLFVAEDRDLLLDPTADDATRERRQRYRRWYSTHRMRRLAEARVGGPQPDLWRGLKLVLDGLDRGVLALALPPLGSFLFGPRATPHLNRSELANRDLLLALRALCATVADGVRYPVDWRTVGAEELGSVYESLLELHPELNVDGGQFVLRTAAGHERKTTGSYYTPAALVHCLLDTALDPVIDRAVQGADPERAILDLKVCDPACGSGHFLLAAARRLAHRLAGLREDEEEPSPPAVRAALRDVVARCIYGVDLNEMAVELCKISLWMEALDPGRPLAFLDSHIKHGNALLGATPKLLRDGIPDDAFKAIEGDDKKTCTALRRRNKKERKTGPVGQGMAQQQIGLSLGTPWTRLGDLAAELLHMEAISDDTIAGQRRKQARYDELVGSQGYAFNRLWADVWCAAFVIEKTADAIAAGRGPITEGTFRAVEANPAAADARLVAEVRALADGYRFFHWHLEFPDVFRVEEAPERAEMGWSGGFDCVLGNPPWERIKLQEKEFFAGKSEAVMAARNSAARKKVIALLAEDDPALFAAWSAALRKADGETRIIRDGGGYPLCGRGDVNTYSIFAELNRSLISASGQMGCIVPTGIATDATTQFYFAQIAGGGELVTFWSFENEDHIFTHVHNAVKFALLTLSGTGDPSKPADYVFFARHPRDLDDAERHFELSADDFELINPNTGNCPTFRSRRDARITRAAYRAWPILLHAAQEASPWGVTFVRMFDMSTDSILFVQHEKMTHVGSWQAALGTPGSPARLYEAKMVHHYDHRLGTYDGQTQAQANKGFLPRLDAAQHGDPNFIVRPRYWVDGAEVASRLKGRSTTRWSIGWRDICRNTDVRTMIAAAIPYAAVGHTLPLAIVDGRHTDRALLLLANLSSFALDYVARQKMSGGHLTYTIVRQLPIVPPDAYSTESPWAKAATLRDWLMPRTVELVYTAWDLLACARDHGHDGPPFQWQEERRFKLRAEVDAAFFHLYGIRRGDVAHVMDSFWIVAQQDVAEHGHYRTRDTILEIYDAMQQAIDSGTPYQTRLDPPPAHPSLCHPESTRPDWARDDDG